MMQYFVRKPEIVGGERMGGFNQKDISISMQAAKCRYVINCWRIEIDGLCAGD
ncbi:MAG: hypothetical protein AB1728_09530 [Bacteroidota bacterium]